MPRVDLSKADAETKLAHLLQGGGAKIVKGIRMILNWQPTWPLVERADYVTSADFEAGYAMLAKWGSGEGWRWVMRLIAGRSQRKSDPVQVRPVLRPANQPATAEGCGAIGGQGMGPEAGLLKRRNPTRSFGSTPTSASSSTTWAAASSTATT